MRQTIQGDFGAVTLVPAGEETFMDAPRHFLDEFDAADFLRAQFLADPNDMTIVRALLDEIEGVMQVSLTDDEVLIRLATHVVSGGVMVVDDGTAWLGGTGGGGVQEEKKKKEEKKVPVKAEDETLIDIVIQLMYWNPVTGQPKAFPKGVKVNLVNKFKM